MTEEPKPSEAPRHDRQTLVPREPHTHVFKFNDGKESIIVVDNYAWIADPRNIEKIRDVAQTVNQLSREYLDQLPGRKQLEQIIKMASGIGSFGSFTPRGELVFQLRRQGDQNQPVLYAGHKNDGIPQHELINVNVNEDFPPQTSYDNTFFGPNGLVAFTTSTGGGEMSQIHVTRFGDGQTFDEVIPNCQLTSVAWQPDGTGFFYARHESPGSHTDQNPWNYRSIYFHELGKPPEQDIPLSLPLNPNKDFPNVQTSPDGQWVSITNHLGPESNDLYIARNTDDKSSLEFVEIAKGIANTTFKLVFMGDRIFIHTNYEAPESRLIELTDLNNPSNQDAWSETIPQTEDILHEVTRAGNKLVLHYQADGSTKKLVFFDPETGKTEEKIFTGVGIVTGIQGQAEDSMLYYRHESPSQPPTVFRIDVDTLDQERVGRLEIDVDLSGLETEIRYAETPDGTKIPVDILKSTSSQGHPPTILSCYGAHGITIPPYFDLKKALLALQGVNFAHTRIRGGGERGKRWHQQAMGDKTVSMRDLNAAADMLVETGLTTKDKIVLTGTSAGGGIVLGAAVKAAQNRPGVPYAAVIANVPLTDYVNNTNPFWHAEYIDPHNRDSLNTYKTHSPRHMDIPPNFPPTFILGSENDPRVPIHHILPMVAVLLDAGVNAPVVAQILTSGGHGGSMDAKIADNRDIDTYAFALNHAGHQFN